MEKNSNEKRGEMEFEESFLVDLVLCKICTNVFKDPMVMKCCRQLCCSLCCERLETPKCPFCQTGINFEQNNRVHYDMLTKLEKMGVKPQGVGPPCNFCHKNLFEATRACSFCFQFMCPLHIENHEKLCSRGTLIAPSAMKDIKKRLICPEHDLRRVAICFKHRDFLCLQCILGGHKTCELSELGDWILFDENQLQEVKTEYEKQKEYIMKIEAMQEGLMKEDPKNPSLEPLYDALKNIREGVTPVEVNCRTLKDCMKNLKEFPGGLFLTPPIAFPPWQLTPSKEALEKTIKEIQVLVWAIRLEKRREEYQVSPLSGTPFELVEGVSLHRFIFDSGEETPYSYFKVREGCPKTIYYFQFKLGGAAGNSRARMGRKKAFEIIKSNLNPNIFQVYVGKTELVISTPLSTPAQNRIIFGIFLDLEKRFFKLSAVNYPSFFVIGSWTGDPLNPFVVCCENCSVYF